VKRGFLKTRKKTFSRGEGVKSVAVV